MAPASKLTARVRRLGLEKGPTVGTSNLRLRFRVRRILRRLKGADVEDEKDLKAVHAYLAPPAPVAWRLSSMTGRRSV